MNDHRVDLWTPAPLTPPGTLTTGLVEYGWILDASGRLIAPPQPACAPRPIGPWTQNGDAR